MAFNYEGAKKEGYSDDEIAEFLAKEKNFNLSGARKEGYSSSEIIQHLLKSNNSEESSYQKYVPNPIKNAVGGIESMGRMLWNVPAGAVVGGLAGLGSLAMGEGVGKAVERQHKAADAVTIDPFTKQGELADQMLAEGYEKLYREPAGNIVAEDLRYDPNAPQGAVRADPKSEAKARSFGEFGADVLGFGGMIKGAVGANRRYQQRQAAEVEARNKKIQEESAKASEIKDYPEADMQKIAEILSKYPDDLQAPQFGLGGRNAALPPGASRAKMPPPKDTYQRNLEMQAELQRLSESEAYRPAPPAEIAAIDAQTPRSPYDVQRTPAQLEKMNQSEFSPPDPNRPFYADPRAGMLRDLPERSDILRAEDLQRQAREVPFEIDTGALDPAQRARGQRPIPYREIPVEKPTKPGDPIPYTREKIPDPTTTPDGFEQLRPESKVETVPFEQLGSPEFAGTTGWQRANPRVAEAIAGDTYLKGMQTRLERMEKNLEGIGRQQSEVAQRYGERRVGGGSGQQIGRELVAYTKSMEAVKRDIQKLKDQIDKRVKMHEDRVRKEPRVERTRPADSFKGMSSRKPLTTVEKTFDPFKKGPSGPKGQRGAIDPDLLTLGLSRLLNRSRKEPPKVELPDPNKRQSLLDMASSKLENFDTAWEKMSSTIKDLPGNAWTKSIEYFSNAQMLYHDTKNPMVKWLATSIADIKSRADLKTEYATQGVQFDSTGFLPKKIVSENSPQAHWFGLSGKERQVAMDIVNKWSGESVPTPDAMRAMGANQKVINALEAIQAPIKQVLADINEKLIANGRNPIQERPFYFMRNAGQGNWLTRIKAVVGTDKNGKPIYETIGFHRSSTRGGADAIAAKLKERFTKADSTVGEIVTEVEKAVDSSRGNKYNVSTTLLEDIFQALEKNDPRRAAINSAIADIKSKGGFGSHRAFRKGVEGMENSPKDFWKTYERYIQDAHTYEAGIELANLRKKIEFTNDMPPNLKQWALGYIDRTRGGTPDGVIRALENGVDNVLSTITGGISRGRLETAPGFARDLTRFTNKMFTTTVLFFWKPPFLVGQALQSTTFAPSIMNLYKAQGHKGSIMGAMAHGAVEMFAKSPEFVRALDYLSARGKVDPGLVSDVSALDVFGAKAQTKAGAMAKSVGEFAIGITATKKLEAMNRVHAAAVGYHFLKDSMSGKELHRGIEQFVDDVMGNYSKSDRPGLITRHGIVGEAVAPLATFANWYKGMTAVMLKEAAIGLKTGNMKKVTPYVSMWLSSALMAGIIGAPFFKEIDFIWDQVKGLFGFNEKQASISEAFLRSGFPDTAKFGAITGLTTFIDPRGIHISGSMSAPEVMPSWIKDGQIDWKNLAPGVVWGANAAKSTTQLALDLANIKKMSIEDRRKALKDLAPTTFDSIINNLDSTFEIGDPNTFKLGFDEGRPVPGRRGAGTVRRDDFGTLASIIGSGTIPEVTEKMVNRDIKERGMFVAEAKAKLAERAVDAIMEGSGDLNEVIKKATALGYTNFDRAIAKAYQTRLQTEAERSVGRGTTLQQYENYKYIKEAVGR